MTDPSARHARVLEDLDRQIEHKRRVIYDYAETDIVPVVEQALRYALGRRNILQRHPPGEVVDPPGEYEGRPYAALHMCAGCSETFPCPDWRDAAGLATGGMYTGPPIPLTAGCVVERDAAGVEEP